MATPHCWCDFTGCYVFYFKLTTWYDSIRYKSFGRRIQNFQGCPVWARGFVACSQSSGQGPIPFHVGLENFKCSGKKKNSLNEMNQFHENSFINIPVPYNFLKFWWKFWTFLTFYGPLCPPFFNNENCPWVQRSRGLPAKLVLIV